MTEQELINALKAPFDPSVIHWRIGVTNQRKVAKETGNNNARPTKGIPLAYIDSRDVMKRLDEVCGAQWQARYPFPGCCEIGIKVDGEWIWRGNGAGQSDIEAEKGQFSDAFKRAAVLWGIGRYLYYLKPETMPNYGWVELDQYGKFTNPTLPAWALPKVA